VGGVAGIAATVDRDIVGHMDRDVAGAGAGRTRRWCGAEAGEVRMMFAPSSAASVWSRNRRRRSSAGTGRSGDAGPSSAPGIRAATTASRTAPRRPWLGISRSAPAAIPKQLRQMLMRYEDPENSCSRATR
jgi:hypothetical protein